MHEELFTLRVLTPLFLTGADQAAAELRAPSFRGLMRYWQRALVGGIVGTDAEGLKKVMEIERSVFGATDMGSAVTVRASAPSHQAREFTKQDSIQVNGQWKATGKDYMLWSMPKSGKVEKKNLRLARWYFPTHTQFQLTLSVRNEHKKQLAQAIAAFWLLAHLGSAGSRARRCAGSLAIQAMAESTVPELSFHESATIEALQNALQQGIQAARNLYALPPAQDIRASFDIVARGHCRIWILHDDGRTWRTPDRVMEAIGANLQAYRSSITPLWKRQIFGLPLNRVSDARRASPLLLRVTKLQGEQYVGIAVLFKTTGPGILPGDYKLIEDWVNAFPGKLEVKI